MEQQIVDFISEKNQGILVNRNNSVTVIKTVLAWMIKNKSDEKILKLIYRNIQQLRES